MGLYDREVNRIKNAQESLAKIQTDIDESIDTLDKVVVKYVKREWDETFPGINVHFLTSFICGSHTNNWTAEVWFYSINNLEPYGNRFYEITYPDEPDENGNYPDPKVEAVNPPIALKKLKNFLKEMSDVLGIPCSLVSSRNVGRERFKRNKNKNDKN